MKSSGRFFRVAQNKKEQQLNFTLTIYSKQDPAGSMSRRKLSIPAIVRGCIDRKVLKPMKAFVF